MAAGHHVVLGTELGPSRRTDIAFNHGTNSLALGVEFLTHKPWGTHQIKAMYERKIFGTIPFISLSRDSETSVKQRKVFSQLAAGSDSSMD